MWFYKSCKVSMRSFYKNDGYELLGKAIIAPFILSFWAVLFILQFVGSVIHVTFARKAYLERTARYHLSDQRSRLIGTYPGTPTSFYL